MGGIESAASHIIDDKKLKELEQMKKYKEESIKRFLSSNDVIRAINSNNLSMAEG